METCDSYFFDCSIKIGDSNRQNDNITVTSATVTQLHNWKICVDCMIFVAIRWNLLLNWRGNFAGRYIIRICEGVVVCVWCECVVCDCHAHWKFINFIHWEQNVNCICLNAEQGCITVSWEPFVGIYWAKGYAVVRGRHTVTCCIMFRGVGVRWMSHAGVGWVFGGGYSKIIQSC